MDRKAPSKSVAASTAALAAAGESSSSGAADGALLLHGKEDKKPGELPAVGGASGSSSPMAVVTVAAARGPSCQAERCAADMSSARRYYRKHKVCEPHSKSTVVLVAGLRQRFCQQCSRRRAMDRKDKSRSRGYSSSAATSMAALAAAAAAGEGSSSGSADGSLPPHEEEEKKPAKLAAVGSASSSTPVPARRGAAAAGGAGRDGPRCQAERCNVDLSEAANYNRRHKVCQTHSKSPVVLVAGLRQRFCQQCSRFHELSEFDDIKRSCRQRLAGHNERRRKSSADAHGGGGGSGSGDGCRHADQDGRGHQGNPPPNQFQIR